MTIEEKLLSLQDEKYRLFQLKLMPTVASERVIGVRTPAIRALAKEINGTSEAEAFLHSLPHKYYDMNNLHGFLIEKKKDFNEIICLLEEFFPEIDNWATCDLISPKVFKKHTDELLPYIKKWIKSGETYTVRFGVEMLMSFYLDDKFCPEYLEIVSVIKSDEYYVNMMIAWFFATALAKQYDAALPYITEQRLDKWVNNKTIQKAVESFRITDEQKAYLKNFKVK